MKRGVEEVAVISGGEGAGESLLAPASKEEFEAAFPLIYSENDTRFRGQHDHEPRPLQKLKKQDVQRQRKVDWASEYGFTTSRKEVGAFSIAFAYWMSVIQISIFRSPKSGDAREDGFDPVDLMFSGQLEITRDKTGAIVNWKSVVNSIQMHHPNHFGPQRGLVIAEMIRVLSLELISVEETFRQHFYSSSKEEGDEGDEEEKQQDEEDDDLGEDEGIYVDSVMNYDMGYMP